MNLKLREKSLRERTQWEKEKSKILQRFFGMNKHKKLNTTEISQECHTFGLRTLWFILQIHLFRALDLTHFGRFPSIFSKIYPCGLDGIVKGIMKRHLQKKLDTQNWLHCHQQEPCSKRNNDTLTKSFCRMWVQIYNHYPANIC